MDKLIAEARLYLTRRQKDRQCDRDLIHAYDAGTDEHVEGIGLRVSTIEALIAALEAAQADNARLRDQNAELESLVEQLSKVVADLLDAARAELDAQL